VVFVILCLLDKFPFQLVSVEKTRADAFHADRQGRGTARQAVNLGVGDHGPMYSSGTAADAVDPGD
jgi:hypothetical protein